MPTQFPKSVSSVSLLTCLFALSATHCQAQEKAPSENQAIENPGDPPATIEAPPLPDLTIPKNASLKQLQAVVETAKGVQPANPQQHHAMQSAIRDASKQILVKLKGKETTPQYQQAEMDTISSSVLLMTFYGEDAKKKTVEQVHGYLKNREKLSMADVQTGIIAAAMLELQPNKKPARDTYELLDKLLEDDEREDMQALRINLKANIRRLTLLGNKFELQAESLDGKVIDIDDYAGKFVVVDFFATWCKPCLSEVPRLEKNYAKYRDKGLEVIGISVDGDKKQLDSYLKKANLPWPIIHDDAENPLDRLQMEFGVSQLPTVLLLNKEGTVVSLEARGAELDRLLQMLFDAPTPAPPKEDAASETKDNAGAAGQ